MMIVLVGLIFCIFQDKDFEKEEKVLYGDSFDKVGEDLKNDTFICNGERIVDLNLFLRIVENIENVLNNIISFSFDVYFGFFKEDVIVIN